MRLEDINKVLGDESNKPAVNVPENKSEILTGSALADSKIQELKKSLELLKANPASSQVEIREKELDIEKLSQEHRKEKFKEMAGSEQLFQATVELYKNKRLLPGFDPVQLPKVTELMERIEASKSLVEPFVKEVLSAKAHIDNIRAENEKFLLELKALQSRLSDAMVKNNEEIKKENDHIKRVFSQVVDTNPLWVAFEEPKIFAELTGTIITTSATAAPTPTGETATALSKHRDTTDEEHRKLLDALKGDNGLANVKEAIAAGASKDSNKDILDKIAMKVFGKTFKHYGTVDNQVYNIRGRLNLR